VGLLAQWRI